ncbi:MAG: hypothetical protein ACRDEA_13385 [Microcystaceae cyanobacterium]
MATNFQNVTFPGGLTVYVQACANAACKQTVTIAPPSGTSGTSAVFSGNGEGNVLMQLQTQGFLNKGSGGGWPYFTTPNQNQNYQYKVTCTNSGGTTSDVQANQSTYSSPSHRQEEKCTQLPLSLKIPQMTITMILLHSSQPGVYHDATK